MSSADLDAAMWFFRTCRNEWNHLDAFISHTWCVSRDKESLALSLPCRLSLSLFLACSRLSCWRLHLLRACCPSLPLKEHEAFYDRVLGCVVFAMLVLFGHDVLHRCCTGYFEVCSDGEPAPIRKTRSCTSATSCSSRTTHKSGRSARWHASCASLPKAISPGCQSFFSLWFSLVMDITADAFAGSGCFSRPHFSSFSSDLKVPKAIVWMLRTWARLKQ